jgi:hypothetical protein
VLAHQAVGADPFQSAAADRFGCDLRRLAHARIVPI